MESLSLLYYSCTTTSTCCISSFPINEAWRISKLFNAECTTETICSPISRTVLIDYMHERTQNNEYNNIIIIDSINTFYD